MLVLSLSTIIEEAMKSEYSSNLSGEIQSFDRLLRKESLELLERHHNGIFAYLAFHPASDQAIIEYIRRGTMSSDSGPNILVLFTLDSEARWATSISEDSFGEWLSIDASLHPSYKLIRILFKGKQTPILPGIALFDRFTTDREPVYIDLQGLSSETQVREMLRTIFSLADNSYKYTQGKLNSNFADVFSIELQKKKLSYQKLGRTSMMEWLIRAYQIILGSKGDIVSALGLFK